MKVLIISGFLGAGKTSFIKAMTKATGKNFVVVENEFGEVNVDSKILSQDEIKIYELTEGCICCSMNMDFSLSVLTISNTLNPEYLIVEPSGVAMPSKILESLKKIEYQEIKLLSPVVVVDAKNFVEQRNFYPEYFNDQLNSAGNVVLSKSENLSEEDFKEIYKILSPKNNTNLNFNLVHYSKWNVSKWNELLNKNLDGNIVIERSELPDEKLSSYTLSKFFVNSPDELIYKLEKLLTGYYGDIIRVKGFANNKNFNLSFSAVNGIFEISECENYSGNGEIVIIGENLNVNNFLIPA